MDPQYSAATTTTIRGTFVAAQQSSFAKEPRTAGSCCWTCYILDCRPRQSWSRCAVICLACAARAAAPPPPPRLVVVVLDQHRQPFTAQLAAMPWRFVHSTHHALWSARCPFSVFLTVATTVFVMTPDEMALLQWLIENDPLQLLSTDTAAGSRTSFVCDSDTCC